MRASRALGRAGSQRLEQQRGLGAALRGIGERDAAAVQFHEFPGDGEAEAHAFAGRFRAWDEGDEGRADYSFHGSRGTDKPSAIPRQLPPRATAVHYLPEENMKPDGTGLAPLIALPAPPSRVLGMDDPEAE